MGGQCLFAGGGGQTIKAHRILTLKCCDVNTYDIVEFMLNISERNKQLNVKSKCKKYIPIMSEI